MKVYTKKYRDFKNKKSTPLKTALCANLHLNFKRGFIYFFNVYHPVKVPVLFGFQAF